MGMKNKLMLLLAGAVLATASTVASAHGSVNFGVYLGAPVYPAPVYSYPPPPVYYGPPPVYYTRPPYYAPPAAVYYAPTPYYYGPRYYGYGHYRGWGRHHRH
jgi:hypothetical protein